jgi:hypothetical protein
MSEKRASAKLLRLHLPQEAIKIEFLFVLPLIPQFSQLIEEALFALFTERASSVDGVVFVDAVDVVFGVRGGRRQGGRVVGVCADVEEVEDLVCLHGAEAGVLLVYDGACDVDFEALKTSFVNIDFLNAGSGPWDLL